MKTSKKGFTLIELLIVVAIIAILAAIAVPNFLEAQVRAKVSRVKADQRTLATALETYYVDNNAYPPNGADILQGQLAPLGPEPGAFIALTTPISYLSGGVFLDPFGSIRAPGGISSMGYIHIEENDPTALAVIGFVNGSPNPLNIGPFASISLKARELLYALRWEVSSRGPDRIQRVEDIDGNISDGLEIVDFGDWVNEFETSPADLLYDPTNGTISNGDIYRTAKGIMIGNELFVGTGS